MWNKWAVVCSEAEKCLNEKINLSKLKVGQVVKFSVDDKAEYIYPGRGKAVWELQTRSSTKLQNERYDSFYGSCKRYLRLIEDVIIHTEIITDNKLSFIFKLKESSIDGDPISWYDINNYRTTGKCVIVGEVTDVPNIEIFQIALPYKFRLDYDLSFPNSSKEYDVVKTINIEIKE